MTGDRKGLVATLVGGIAVLLWSLLALLTVAAGEIPPFQLLAMTFSIAFVAMMALLLRRGLSALSVLQQPWQAWALGVGALFGYHAFYFVALQNAPPVEASLIAFLWPLLLVLLSALAPGGQLRWFHLLGALLGFAGAVLLVSGGMLAFKAQFWLGYLSAFVCALVWSSYSVANRRFGQVSSEAVGGYCGVVAVLGYFFHLVFEKTVIPADGLQWLAVLGLGLGPVGLAFSVWDYGTKHGSLPVLGAFSYAAPLLSTLLLIAFGRAEGTWIVGLACLLIVGGALLAAQELLFRRRPAAAAPPPANGKAQAPPA